MVSKIGRIVVVIGLILVGTWLTIRSASPAAESSARVAAIRQAAPASRIGSSSAGQVSDMVVAEPRTVDLRSIPAGVYDPDNQYDRWQRGEIDLLENEGILSAAEMAKLRADSERLPASGNITLADGADGIGSNAPSPAGASFDSIDYTDCCGGGGNVPPDPELAVGPNHVIAVVNVALEIYNKNGNSLVGPTTFASFFNSDPNCTGVFDPNALYDEEADRYMVGIDADGFYYCIGVSQTGDPTGNWNIYSFPTASGADFFDYPHAGVGRDAIYMGANIFDTGFKESRVWAFDKWAMYNGASAAGVSKPLPTSEDTPQPLNLHGWQQNTWPTSGPHYFFTETDYNGATYSVWSWANPFGGTSPSKVGTVNLTTFTGVSAGMPVAVPQNGGQTIQGNDYRPQDFEYRNGYAWGISTVACNPGGGTVNCIRWAQINPATATIVDAGVYSSSGEYRFFGDLAVNHCGDVAVGYTKSSTSMWPSVFYTGRKAGDAAGTLQAEAQLKAGELAYTAFDSAPRRWGDYTEMTIAPDGTTFWYLGEYSKNTGTNNGRWGTWIGSFTYADCTTGGPPPTATPTNTPGPDPTATPTSTPPAAGMHIGDLDGSSVYTNNNNRWRASVTFTVHNGSHGVVSKARVTGKWSNGASGSASCTTNTAGQCTINKPKLLTNVSSVTFTVTKVTRSGQTYSAASNHDPDGDSNGTYIVVQRP